MSNFVRIWQEVKVNDIEQHLLVIGELSAECYNCHNLGLPVSATACPQCQARFKYLGFRRTVDIQAVKRFKDMHPSLIMIDFQDFKKLVSKSDARKLLDL